MLQTPVCSALKLENKKTPHGRRVVSDERVCWVQQWLLCPKAVVDDSLPPSPAEAALEDGEQDINTMEMFNDADDGLTDTDRRFSDPLDSESAAVGDERDTQKSVTDERAVAIAKRKVITLNNKIDRLTSSITLKSSVSCW